MGRYGSHYSDDSFWKKARKFASKAGREVIEKALARISHRESRKGNFSRFFDAALGQSRS